MIYFKKRILYDKFFIFICINDIMRFNIVKINIRYFRFQRAINLLLKLLNRRENKKQFFLIRFFNCIK